MTVAMSPTKEKSSTFVESKTGSPSLQICGRCLDGWHKCWPGECACTQCNKAMPVLRKPVQVRKPPKVRKPKPPKGVPHPVAKVTPLDTDLVSYIARQLIEDAGSPHRVSQPEWDAVHYRHGWTHMEVAIDLDITYERVRYIRRMPRPVDEHVAPAYRDIAYRAGCTVSQVYKVMQDLVALRDGNPEDRPENGCSFS